MRRPVVDYKEFRFSRINEERFRHLWLLTGWLVYFALFLLTENLIPESKCHIIHSPIDDLIPFHEIFFIPYFFWYILIIISLVYFGLYNIKSFKRLQTYIIITQLAAMVIYILYPSCQQLRPLTLPRDNLLSDCVKLLYTVDTNTGVFPSLHCAYSFGIASVWMREKDSSMLWKVFVVLSVILICMSTMFIKQHSFLDFLSAIPIGLLAEILVFKVIYP